VPSVKRDKHLALLALAGVFAAGSLSGCSTTQEKAAAHRAESARILKAREKRQKARKHQKPNADGTKTAPSKRKSSRRQGGGGK